ncbi:MAG: hypothetical protein KGM98_10160, partial [Bacteroidota bacterium]|nr:hypothetical protein [Bacteroidota bacterium]
MWIWWIISLIILIACMVFTYRMIVTSYEFLPSDKRSLRDFYKLPAPPDSHSVRPESIRTLKNRVQDFEDHSDLYEIQIHKLQQRIKALEEKDVEVLQPRSKPATPKHIEEDWKELFYEENEKKEKLENELDETRQILEETEKKLEEAKEALYDSRKKESAHEGSDAFSEIELLHEELQHTRMMLSQTEQRLQETQVQLETARQKEAIVGDPEDKRVISQLENELYQTRQILRVTEKQMEETRDALEAARKIERIQGDPADKKAITRLEIELEQTTHQLKDTKTHLEETRQALEMAQKVEVIQGDPADKEAIKRLEKHLNEANDGLKELTMKLSLSDIRLHETQAALQEAKKVEVIRGDPADKEAIQRLEKQLDESREAMEALSIKLDQSDMQLAETRQALEVAQKVEVIHGDPADKQAITQLEKELSQANETLKKLDSMLG